MLFFGNAKVYLFLMKQVSEWTRFVQLDILQKFCILFLSDLELLISMLKSPITIRFLHLHKALLITALISSKNVQIFPVDGGLYIPKQIHFFFEIVNSEQIHSLPVGPCFLILLQIKPCLSNSIIPPLCLCISRLVLTSYPLSLNWTFGKLSYNWISLITK